MAGRSKRTRPAGRARMHWREPGFNPVQSRMQSGCSPECSAGPVTGFSNEDASPSGPVSSRTAGGHSLARGMQPRPGVNRYTDRPEAAQAKSGTARSDESQAQSSPEQSRRPGGAIWRGKLEGQTTEGPLQSRCTPRRSSRSRQPGSRLVPACAPAHAHCRASCACAVSPAPPG